MNPEAQNGDGTAAVADATPAPAPQPAGPSPSQTVADRVVDPAAAANAGNSGQPDPKDPADNGAAADDDERSRPARSDRKTAGSRISELAKLAKSEKERADSAEERNKELEAMLANPIDEAQVKLELPDYSGRESVTNAEIQGDIKKAAIQAADQIVKLRLKELIPANNRANAIQQYRERAYNEMNAAITPGSAGYRAELDPDSENFNAADEQFLVETFKRTFAADPTFRFRDLVKQYFSNRAGRDQTNTNDNGTNPNTALRQRGAGRAKPHKPISEMSADEYKAYLKSSR